MKFEEKPRGLLNATKLKDLLGALALKGFSFEAKENSLFPNKRKYSITIVDDSLSSDKIAWLIKQGFELEGGFFVLWFEL